MIEQLFGSKTRVKLLRLFYANPNRSFYVREITRKVDEQINSVRRELANLLAVGIITSDNTNNRLYYEVNQKYLHYEPFRAIFGGVAVDTTSVGAEEQAPVAHQVSGPAKDMQLLGNVELAVYTGKFTRDESSGIDFLVVGDINRAQLQKYVADLEAKENKEVRYTVLTLDEFRYREQIHDRFITTVKAAKKQVLLDKQHLLG